MMEFVVIGLFNLVERGMGTGSEFGNFCGTKLEGVDSRYNITDQNLCIVLI